jgi:hypothetical protein
MINCSKNHFGFGFLIYSVWVGDKLVLHYYRRNPSWHEIIIRSTLFYHIPVICPLVQSPYDTSILPEKVKCSNKLNPTALLKFLVFHMWSLSECSIYLRAALVKNYFICILLHKGLHISNVLWRKNWTREHWGLLKIEMSCTVVVLKLCFTMRHVVVSEVLIWGWHFSIFAYIFIRLHIPTIQ